MKIAATLLSLLAPLSFARTTSQLSADRSERFCCDGLGRVAVYGGPNGPKERQSVDLVSLAKVSGYRKVSTATALFPDYFVCGRRPGH